MPQTIQDLVTALAHVYKLGNSDENRDYKKYRYIIYARKSTEGQERQVRSLEDQVAECLILANKLELNVVATVQESMSASEPDKRPKFMAMLKDIKANKYDAIIAWHPDRLARNMKDAGEVIDLLDKGTIANLNFVSFTFENNTLGKMLLGMAFVISKQYSDQLSDNVNRGNYHSMEEGKWLNRPKHGYYKDITGHLRPDGNNYTIIKGAFAARLEGKPLEVIAAEINQLNYQRVIASGHRPFRMNKQVLSTIFKEPLYAGAALYGKHVINLEEKDPGFAPMITVDEYFILNKNSAPKSTQARIIRSLKLKREVKADLLRGMIICGFCSKPLVAAISSRSTNGRNKAHYFYYRCDTPNCVYKAKSIRAKVIVDFARDFLEKHPFTTPAIYSHYVEDFNRVGKQKNAELEFKLNSMRQRKVQLEGVTEKTKALLLENPKGNLAEELKEDIEKQREELNTLTAIIKKTEEDLANTKTVPLTFQEFVKLFGNLAERIGKIGKMSDLDNALRKIFLNFTVEGQKIANYTINSPFREFIETSFVLNGRGNRT